jgi:hypothetical protein
MLKQTKDDKTKVKKYYLDTRDAFSAKLVVDMVAQ